MFELIFGLIWTIFSMAFAIIMIFAEGTEEIGIFPFIFISLFIIIGLFFLIKGIKKLIKDIKTNAYGEECYGYIQNLYPDGSYVNGNPEYKADILTYIPSKNNVEQITEVVGFDINKYPMNSYVKGRYYEGDINIEEKLESKNLIPADAMKFFNDTTTSNGTETNQDIIIVDGHQYKRID